MIRNLSIKKQLIIGFLFILCSSIILTIVTFIVLYNTWWIKSGSNQLLQADHYASYVPAIKEHAYEKGDQLLHEDEWKELENVIPTEGMNYQLLDEKGSFVTGTYQEEIPEDKALAELINLEVNSGRSGNNITYYIPLTNNEGALKGALVLNYDINLSTTSFIDFVILVIAFLSPFFYFTIFTLIVSHFIGKKMSQPIEDLIIASHRIKERDLNFELSYNSQNELGELVSAFEKMREELESSLTREWELEAERRQYIDAISHDLKTPLTIIRGHVEALEDVWGNEEIFSRYVKTIEKNVDRVNHLLNEFNRVNEIDRHDFKIEAHECDIDSWLQGILYEYQCIAEQKGICFEYHLHVEDGAETFFIDEQRMNRVIDNIVMNSLRFTPKNGEIKVYAIIEEGLFEFHVYDTGRGFQTKNTEKLFTRFYQEDQSRTESDNHTGQGLFIAKTIVEKHGGEIYARNRIDSEGAHVTFLIPNQVAVAN